MFGTLGLLFERSHPTEAARGIPFAMALTYHGYMMLLHQQANFTASLLHKTHGGETRARLIHLVRISIPIFWPELAGSSEKPRFSLQGWPSRRACCARAGRRGFRGWC